MNLISPLILLVILAIIFGFAGLLIYKYETIKNILLNKKTIHGILNTNYQKIIQYNLGASKIEYSLDLQVLDISDDKQLVYCKIIDIHGIDKMDSDLIKENFNPWVKVENIYWVHKPEELN